MRDLPVWKEKLMRYLYRVPPTELFMEDVARYCYFHVCHERDVEDVWKTIQSRLYSERLPH